MKKVECCSCGIKRRAMVKSEVYDQKVGFKIKYNWMCQWCFARREMKINLAGKENEAARESMIIDVEEE